MSDIDCMVYSEDMEIDAFLQKYGDVRILEHLAARFDYLFQDGVVRGAAEQDQIAHLLQAMALRISRRQAPTIKA